MAQLIEISTAGPPTAGRATGRSIHPPFRRKSGGGCVAGPKARRPSLHADGNSYVIIRTRTSTSTSTFGGNHRWQFRTDARFRSQHGLFRLPCRSRKRSSGSNGTRRCNHWPGHRRRRSRPTSPPQSSAARSGRSRRRHGRQGRGGATASAVAPSAAGTGLDRWRRRGRAPIGGTNTAGAHAPRCS